MSLTTAAGRELLDSCRIANPLGAKDLAFKMATLFCSSAQERTIARLDDAGIFINPKRREHLSPDDLALLLSDEGLQLWLRFAASPPAYLSVFVDLILNETPDTQLAVSLASALRMLVISGRDATNNVAASEVLGSFHPPLSHLCSQVAPEWLPSLLEYGSDPNQVTARGIPLVATAMAAQAERVHLEGHDLLIPHMSLHQLGTLLRSHGASLSQHTPTGAPPVVLLALNGYCAAAETLLAVGAGCNSVEDSGNSNTLMHYLAAATHLKQHSFTAFLLLTLTLRFGGDPDLPNQQGVTACSLLPASLTQYLRLSQTMIAQAREQAKHRISAPMPQQENPPLDNVPPFVAAIAVQARRLFERGHDPLLPHESLFQLGASFQRGGVDLGQRHPDGTPPVLWLTLRGYCGAAEVLLALNPNANTPAPGGNTLMHAMAIASRMPEDTALADYMLTTLLRYGGNPTLTNQAGHTALSCLPSNRSRFVRAGFAFITSTRTSADQTVTRRRQSFASPFGEPVRHSVAFL